MSLATICVIILVLLILRFSKDKEYHLFLLAGCLGLYIKLGSFLKAGTFESFTREYFVLAVLIILKVSKLIKNKETMVNKKLIISAGLILFSVLVGFISLLVNPIKPEIAPVDVTYDTIVLEEIPLSIAKFDTNNIAALILFGIFLLSAVLCREYFYKQEYVDKTIKFFLLTIKIFFGLMIIEAIITNIFNYDGLRKVVMAFFGEVSNDKTYSFSTVRFLGLKSAFVFYSEPSYVCGPLLVFYLINFVKGRITKENILWFLISFGVAVLSGSTNCIITALFGIFVLLKILITDENISLKKKTAIFSCLLLVIIGALIAVTANEAEIWNNGFNKIYAKLNAYFTSTKPKNPSTVSGYIRSYGNSVCYSVLKTNPLFGVGLGTTRGYGLIPSMLATLGIVGSILMTNFYRIAFNIKISKKNIISFICLLGILTGFYSSSNIYSFVLIPVLISFNALCTKKEVKQ